MKPKALWYRKPAYVKTVKAYEKEKERKQKNYRKWSPRFVHCNSREDLKLKSHQRNE